MGHELGTDGHTRPTSSLGLIHLDRRLGDGRREHAMKAHSSLRSWLSLLRPAGPYLGGAGIASPSTPVLAPTLTLLQTFAKPPADPGCSCVEVDADGLYAIGGPLYSVGESEAFWWVLKMEAEWEVGW